MPRPQRIRIAWGIVLIVAGLAIANLGPFAVVYSARPEMLGISVSSADQMARPANQTQITNRKALTTMFSGYAVAGVGFIFALATWLHWFIGPKEIIPKPIGNASKNVALE